MCVRLSVCCSVSLSLFAGKPTKHCPVDTCWYVIACVKHYGQHADIIVPRRICAHELHPLYACRGHGMACMLQRISLLAPVSNCLVGCAYDQYAALVCLHGHADWTNSMTHVSTVPVSV